MTNSPSSTVLPGLDFPIPWPAAGTVSVLMGDDWPQELIAQLVASGTAAGFTPPCPPGIAATSRRARTRLHRLFRANRIAVDQTLRDSLTRFGLAAGVVKQRWSALTPPQQTRVVLAATLAAGLGATRQASAAELTSDQHAATQQTLGQAPDRQPQLLALSDPFSSLPAHERTGVRARFHDALREAGLAAVVATNSLVDAAALSAEVHLVENGQLVDSGTLAQVLTDPLGSLPAALMGVNVFSGLARKGWLSIGHSQVRARTELDGKVYVTIPRDAVALSFDEHDPSFSDATVFEAVVVGLRDAHAGIQLKLSPVDTEVGLALEAQLCDLSSLPAAGQPLGVRHPGLGADLRTQLDAVRVGTRVFVQVDTAAMHAYSVDPS